MRPDIINVDINNIQLYENSSGHSGGGMSLFESNGMLNQITVVKNIANYYNDVVLLKMLRNIITIFSNIIIKFVL